MKWHIHYNAADRIVMVVVSGTIRADLTAQMANEGIAIARENSTNRFLIDYTMADVGDTLMDTYTFMSNLERLGILPTDRIAIVFTKNPSQHEFAETVAYNRGWSETIRYFSDTDQAKDWLALGDS